MQLFSYRKTMANAKPYRPPVEMSAIEIRRRSLEIECATLSAKRQEEETRLAALRKEAKESIDAANEALRILHEKWAAEERERERQVRSVPKPMLIDAVARRICRVFKISRLELESSRRDQRVVLARQAVFYWCSRRTNKSLVVIGRHIGGRDHTTVRHGKLVYVDKRAAMGRHLRSV